jgi:GMP synthase-like glutamine amidotransferase
MNPIAIFRHIAFEGPGFLADFLNARHIPWQLIDATTSLPTSAANFSGLVFMGGPMSVNDDLPWIAGELALIQEAVALNIPVLGHCLGAQLMSRALGGEVTKNPIKELGWGIVQVSDNEVARSWFNTKTFDAFHWHGETFSLPQGATHLLSSDYCENQAWSMGVHLALQCHIEMTDQMIIKWGKNGADEIMASLSSTAVQTALVMQQQAALKLPLLQAVATQLYTKWLTCVATNRTPHSSENLRLARLRA